MRRVIRAVATVLGLWAALALAPAHLFVTGWTRGQGQRVAVLPDSDWLAIASAVTMVLVAAAALVWRWRRRSVAQLVDDVTPLAVLSVLALPYLPLAADLLPGLTVFTGPFRWIVVVVAMVATGCRVARPLAGALVHRIDAHPAWLLLVAFVTVGTVGLWHTAIQGLGGDEPHYLIITESLLRDGDLRIENNHEQRDYARFIDYEISPDFLQRGRDEVIYSIHAPGLPALVLPAYAAGGVPGVTVLLAFIAALTGLGVFRVARAVATADVALATWAAIVFTTPMFVQGWLIFPEVPAACIVSWCAWWLLRPDDGCARTWGLRGLAIAALPWLHTKFSVLLAVLALALVVRLLARRRWLEAVALALPVGASGLLWLTFFYVLYGTFDPTIAYGEGIAATYQLAWANVPRGVLGFLFDQEYGLLVYSPAYLLCLAGLAPLRRARRRAPWRGPARPRASSS